MPVQRLTKCLLIATLAAPTAVIGAEVEVQPPAAQDSASTAAGTTLDRELVVRFTRAYGMAKQAVDEHADEPPPDDERNAMLRKPELQPPLESELRRILDLNGLARDEWQFMLARMETDDDLRRRIESLSIPFE